MQSNLSVFRLQIFIYSQGSFPAYLIKKNPSLFSCTNFRLSLLAFKLLIHLVAVGQKDPAPLFTACDNSEGPSLLLNFRKCLDRPSQRSLLRLQWGPAPYAEYTQCYLFPQLHCIIYETVHIFLTDVRQQLYHMLNFHVFFGLFLDFSTLLYSSVCSYTKITVLTIEVLGHVVLISVMVSHPISCFHFQSISGYSHLSVLPYECYNQLS